MFELSRNGIMTQESFHFLKWEISNPKSLISSSIFMRTVCSTQSEISPREKLSNCDQPYIMTVWYSDLVVWLVVIYLFCVSFFYREVSRYNSTDVLFYERYKFCGVLKMIGENTELICSSVSKPTSHTFFSLGIYFEYLLVRKTRGFCGIGAK